MEYLKNVLIKEVDGSKTGDKVFVIDNLPKNFIYHQVKKLVPDYTNPYQPLVADFELDERGRKIPTGAVVDELLPGIEASQTGDGGFCFFIQYNEAKARLADIDRFINQNAPMGRVPTRESYSTQPGVPTAGPRSISDLPRVVLTEPVSPPEKSVQATAAPTESLVQEKPKRQWTDEQKKAAAERLATARAAKKAKAEAK